MKLGKELTPLRKWRGRPKAPEGYAYCNECELFKPEDQFHKTAAGKTRYRCKACQSDYQRRTNNEKKVA